MAKLTKEEALARLRNARSWTETGLTLKDICDALESRSNAFEPTASREGMEALTSALNELKTREKQYVEQIKEMTAKNERLTATNKQLRAENKMLKAETKE